MQTKFFLQLSLAITLLAATSSCKKDKPVETLSKTDILTTGQWKMSALTLTPPIDMDGDGTPDTDAFTLMEPCDRDNFFIFKKGGEMETNEGVSKCDDSHPQVKMSTWAFSNNETEITIDGLLCTIQELTSSQLRVKAPVASSIGDMTYVR